MIQPLAQLVILDINLPKKRGLKFLRTSNGAARCRGAVVIVVSTSNTAKDRDAVMQGGANAYFESRRSMTSS